VVPATLNNIILTLEFSVLYHGRHQQLLNLSDPLQKEAYFQNRGLEGNNTPKNIKKIK
jgi:hypothetical protein